MLKAMTSVLNENSMMITDEALLPLPTCAAPLSTSRQALYAQLEQEVKQQLCLRDITSPDLQERYHRNWVWDATQLPTHSHYVPVFLSLLKKYEFKGILSPEKHILVETTTGNAGAAIAYLAQRLGYDLIVFMPEDMPKHRIDDVKQYMPSKHSSISELRLTPEKQYVQGMVEAFQSFYTQHKKNYKGKKLFAINHSRRKESTQSIELLLLDLFQQLPKDITIDIGVVALGNGTTSTGMAKAMQTRFPSSTVIGMEPFESPSCYLKKYGEDTFRQKYHLQPQCKNHKLLGTGGWGVDFPNINLELIDQIELVSEKEWKICLSKMSPNYAVGHSSAACQCIVQRLSSQYQHQALNFFSIFYDPINKY